MDNTIEGKVVPPLGVKLSEVDGKTQDDFCTIAKCEDMDLDCKDCLFDSKRCPKLLFEKWLEQTENE